MNKRIGALGPLGIVFFASAVTAQPPPPPPAAPPPPPPAAGPASPEDPFAAPSDEEPQAEPTPEEPSPPPAGEPAPPASASTEAGATATPAGAAAGAGAAASAGAADSDSQDELDEKQRQRLEQRKLQPGLKASTGLMRTYHAGSGPVGTFRFGFLTSYFSDKAFLCPQCSDSEGGPGSIPDNVQRVEAHLQVSATPADFLEAYLGVGSTATSNTRGDPELLQVLGDSTWGVKAFMPYEPDKTFSVGGAAELWLLNGTGGVGIDRASFALRFLSSFDFNNRTKREDRVPLRFNFNLSYIFDNSGKLVESIEDERNQTITRIERYGLNVNRLDHFTPAFGFEGTFEAIRPYLEWSIDVPANRQDYRCAPGDVFASDVCLEKHITFESAPSRLTLGTRALLFLDGLALHAAVDLGTGGTTPPFWEEMQPESPWMFHFGVSYAADTEPLIKIRKIETPAPPPPVEKPDLFIQGVVVEEGTETPVPNAIVRYQGRALTGMITDEVGRFTTAPVEPGSYAFQVSALDYEDGTCTVEVAAPPPPAAPPPATNPDGTVNAGAAPTASAQPGAPPPPAAAAPAAPSDGFTQAKCQLKAKPKLGSALVYAVSEDDTAIPYAEVTAIDALGRPLTMEADDQGAVAFVNVVPGPLTVVVEAEGHLRGSAKMEVEGKTETRAQVKVFKRPKRSSLNVSAKGIALRKPIEFAPGTSQLLPESQAVVDELADLLRSKPDLGPVEIQAHTDDSSPADIGLQLSTQRANVVRDALIANGVAAPRLLAKGYGSTAPLGGNASSPKNNRIELVVIESTVLP